MAVFMRGTNRVLPGAKLSEADSTVQQLTRPLVGRVASEASGVGSFASLSSEVKSPPPTPPHKGEGSSPPTPHDSGSNQSCCCADLASCEAGRSYPAIMLSTSWPAPVQSKVR